MAGSKTRNSLLLSTLVSRAKKQSVLALLLSHQPCPRRTLHQAHAHLLTSCLLLRHGTGTSIWNSLIRSYALGTCPDEAIHLYRQTMRLSSPGISTNTFTYVFLLKACADSFRAFEGRQLHSADIKIGFELHIYVHTSLVDMYAQCRELGDARKAFDEMREKNSVTWNALISGAAKWGDLGLAIFLFHRIPNKNVVSWTAIIDGCTRAGMHVEALGLFAQMMAAKQGMPTEITILAVVPAVSNLGRRDFAGCIHAYCEKMALAALDVRVLNSFIDMYAKCSSIWDSYRIFNEMLSRRNLVSWTSIISGFAMHGMAAMAVDLFEWMNRVNVRPNRVTFLVVLNACSHGGLMEEGMKFFTSMVCKYGIEPDVKHYGSMIDMLGRVGRLREAEKMIANMAMEANAVVWRTLLGCCSKYGDIEMGERVMRRIQQLESKHSGDYVVLSNMLNEDGRFADAEDVRLLIDHRNITKAPGLSLIDDPVS